MKDQPGVIARRGNRLPMRGALMRPIRSLFLFSLALGQILAVPGAPMFWN
jgi:hypothetical protein